MARQARTKEGTGKRHQGHGSQTEFSQTEQGKELGLQGKRDHKSQEPWVEKRESLIQLLRMISLNHK